MNKHKLEATIILVILKRESARPVSLDEARQQKEKMKLKKLSPCIGISSIQSSTKAN